MPYLSSVWFVQAMLCKVTDTAISAQYIQKSNSNSHTETFNAWTGWYETWNINWHQFWGENLTALYSWTATIQYTATISGSGTKNFNIYDITAGTQKGTASTTGIVSLSLDLVAWHKYAPNRYSSSTISGTYTRSTPITITYQISLYKKFIYNGRTNDIFWLWEPGYITIFWVYNKDFFAWIETTTATTWNITPWNFVGYLKIGDYKIPYYK